MASVAAVRGTWVLEAYRIQYAAAEREYLALLRQRIVALIRGRSQIRRPNS